MDIKIENHKKPYLRYLSITVVVVLMIAGIVMAKNHFGEATAFVSVEQLRISQVKNGNFQVNVRGVGLLKPQKVVWLSSRVAGRVETIYLRAGANVAKGQAIVKLNNPQLAQLAIGAQSALDQLVAENKAAEASLDSQVLDAEARVSRAKMDFNGNKLELDAQNRLRQMGNSTVSDIEYQRSAFRVDSTKLDWQIQQKKLAKLKVNVAALKQAQRVKQTHRQNELQRAHNQIDNLIVRASEDGVLQSMELALGQNIAMGGSIGKIADPGLLLAQINIQELQIKDVELGQSVQIDTRKSQISGRVIRIDPQVIKGMVAVEVELYGQMPSEARPELSIEGIIQITNKDNTLYVKKPHYALDHQTTRVFRINKQGNLADAIDVEFGQSSINDIDITAGLQPVDRIIVSKTDDFGQNSQIFLSN
ncbi:MAG: efflux RND transporter periplasmic adaptor subunit [Psychrosphaera sp.]|nr:efflux RND transporter periplasmic adaptor subunit [Psychrosphaera sp.]